MRFALLALVLAGCNVVYPGDGRHVSVHPEGHWSDTQLAALDAACHIWDDAGVHLRVDDGNNQWVVPTHYELIPWWVDTGEVVAAGAYVIDLGEVWCTPKFVSDGNGLVQCFAHELGHSIGLRHVSQGIMGAQVSSYTTLQPDDLAEHARVWP